MKDSIDFHINIPLPATDDEIECLALKASHVIRTAADAYRVNPWPTAKPAKPAKPDILYAAGTR